MEQYGLKGAYAQYLLMMHHYPAGITAAQLRELCDKDKAAVSRVLSELEAKGLVTRADSKDSAYRARLRLTDEGEAAAAYVCRRATAAVELAGRGLEDPERKVFYATLELIASNLQKICKEGIPHSAEQP